MSGVTFASRCFIGDRNLNVSRDVRDVEKLKGLEHNQGRSLCKVRKAGTGSTFRGEEADEVEQKKKGGRVDGRKSKTFYNDEEAKVGARVNTLNSNNKVSRADS